jgi:hypothetical protein
VVTIINRVTLSKNEVVKTFWRSEGEIMQVRKKKENNEKSKETNKPIGPFGPWKRT